MKKYFTHNGKEQKGPFDLTELLSQTITKDTLVWFEGLEYWKKAGELPELSNVIIVAPPQLKTSPPPLPSLQQSNSTSGTTLQLPTNVQAIVKSSWISPSLFALGALLFFMPFFDFKCQNSTVLSVSGFDMVKGKRYQSMQTELLDGSSSAKYETIPPNAFAIIPFILAICGAVLPFIRKEDRLLPGWLAIAGGMAVISILILGVNVHSEISGKGGGIISVEFDFAYYMAFLLLAFATIISFINRQQDQYSILFQRLQQLKGFQFPSKKSEVIHQEESEHDMPNSVSKIDIRENVIATNLTQPMREAISISTSVTNDIAENNKSMAEVKSYVTESNVEVSNEQGANYKKKWILISIIVIVVVGISATGFMLFRNGYFDYWLKPTTVAREDSNISVKNLPLLLKSKNYSGKIGSISSTWTISWYDDRTVQGKYLYSNGKSFQFKGSEIQNFGLRLDITTDGRPYGLAAFELKDQCYVGKIYYNSGKSDQVKICKW